MVSEREYWEAIRKGDQALATERDRRYAEVASEKEKALRIKEDGDREALKLARTIQDYKDTKANELREQISSERGIYATKDDLQNLSREFQAALKPLSEFMAGGYAVKDSSRYSMTTVLQLIGVLVAIGVALAAVLLH
jgi:hypothetical protein